MKRRQSQRQNAVTICSVLEAVQNGEISEAQVDASVKRILKWKQNLGIFSIDTYQKKVKSTEPTDTVGSEE